MSQKWGLAGHTSNLNKTSILIEIIYHKRSALMPTLRQFEYLVALADLRHFGRAAAATHCSQPTLSHQLGVLEKRLSVKLVERGSGNVELTPIGREIAQRAQKVLAEVRDIRDIATRSSDGMSGTLRFGVSPTLGPYLLPQIIALLHREHPDLRFYIREGIPDDQSQELARGSLDLLMGPLPMNGVDLEIEPLFRERLLVVCASDHPLAARSALTASDLHGTEILSLDRRHHYHHQIAALCSELGANLIPDYEGTSLDSLRQMVASGLGMAILPEFYLYSEAGGKTGIKVLKIRNWKASRSIALGWRRGAAYQLAYKQIARRIQTEAQKLLKTHSDSLFQ